MPKEKIMSHNARVNDALVELMEGVDTKYLLNADFWVAVRDVTHIERSAFYGAPSNEGVKRHQKRMERLSNRGLDGFSRNDVMRNVWLKVNGRVYDGVTISEDEKQDMVGDILGVLKPTDAEILGLDDSMYNDL